MFATQAKQSVSFSSLVVDVRSNSQSLDLTYDFQKHSLHNSRDLAATYRSWLHATFAEGDIPTKLSSIDHGLRLCTEMGDWNSFEHAFVQSLVSDIRTSGSEFTISSLDLSPLSESSKIYQALQDFASKVNEIAASPVGRFQRSPAYKALNEALESAKTLQAVWNLASLQTDRDDTQAANSPMWQSTVRVWNQMVNSYICSLNLQLERVSVLPDVGAALAPLTDSRDTLAVDRAPLDITRLKGSTEQGRQLGKLIWKVSGATDWHVRMDTLIEGEVEKLPAPPTEYAPTQSVFVQSVMDGIVQQLIARNRKQKNSVLGSKRMRKIAKDTTTRRPQTDRR